MFGFKITCYDCQSEINLENRTSLDNVKIKLSATGLNLTIKCTCGNEITIDGITPIQDYFSEMTLEQLKELKNAEIFKKMYESIYQGFESDASGELHNYSWDTNAQLNFIKQKTDFDINPELTQCMFGTKEGAILHTKEQFENLLNDAGLHEKVKWTKAFNLNNAVKLATTTGELSEIIVDF